MFAATFFALLSSAAGMASVAIPRCCPQGSALSPEALANDELNSTDVLEACVAVTNETAWAPGVYVNARNTFLLPGRIPSHWQLQYSSVPVCRTLIVLEENDVYLRADNGRLLVAYDNSAGVALEGFCVDATVTLACAHVSKCCDVRSVFDGVACVADKSGAQAVLWELQALDEVGVARYGWPACAPDERPSAVGELSAARYDGRALQLHGERFEEGAWCAEANRNDKKLDQGALVYTCALAQTAEEQHSQSRGRPEDQQHQMESLHEKAQKLDTGKEQEETPSETSCSSWNVLYIVVGMALMAAALLAGFVSGRFCLRRKETRGLYKRAEGAEGNVA